MNFRINPGAATPVYEQLRAHIAGAIYSGQLVDGQRLPTTRALATELGVAVNTVIRAYRELSDAGLVETRRRYGTVVTSNVDNTAPAEVVAAATRLVLRSRTSRWDTARLADIVIAAAAQASL